MDENEHPRKCENWLSDFLKWTLPRSEAKESYIFWTGLFSLSCVLRRHVKVGREYLGSWECYPYLYLLFIGPAGNKKTTTVSYSDELLNQTPGLSSAPTQVTVPKLASSLTEAEECALYINAGELSEFIAKSGVDMWSFLTKAFDGAKTISIGTHIRDLELAESPCINFLGATTMETLSEILPQSSLDGGFGRRCIFVYEDTTRRRKLMYNDVDTVSLYDKHFQNLVHDLKFISNNLFGNFKFTDEAINKFNDWYIGGAGWNKKNGKMRSRLKGYYETKPAFVMKIAMLLKIANGDTIHKDQLILDWKTLEEGIQVIEGCEENMNHVVSGMGRNVYKSDIKSIFEFIRDNQPILLSVVLREFSSTAEPGKLIELINGLAKSSLISMIPKGTNIMLEVRK